MNISNDLKKSENNLCSPRISKNKQINILLNFNLQTRNITPRKNICIHLTLF